MGGFTSLATAVSGLRAAQTGLAITGHNMANSEIYGYSRQRIIQKDYYYQSIGQGPYGVLKSGMGTEAGAIEQIRNQFLDVSYRKNFSRLNFYSVKATCGAEIESLLGEMQGSYNFQSVINDMWYAMQELSKHPDGIETRELFLATSKSFINKANEVYDGLFEYQRRLDLEVRGAVKDVNSLVSRINELNSIISGAESSGDKANDYRDERNVCLDELSGILSVDYYEDSYGNVNILAEGHQLLVQGQQNYLGLKYTSDGYSLVEPVFTSSKDILPADTPPSQFEPLFNYNRPYDAIRDNDYGMLKGLILARGAMPAYYNGTDMLVVPVRTDFNSQDAFEAAEYNYKCQKWSIENALLPKTMMHLDAIVNSIVTMINDAAAPYTATGAKDPDAPYDLNGNQSYVEIFKRVYVDRWNATTGDYNDVVQGDYYSQYSIGNIILNPVLNEDGGYNLMAFSLSGDREDNLLLLEKLLVDWSDPGSAYAVEIDGVNYGIQDAYQKFITLLGLEVEESNNYVSAQTLQTNEADSKRNSIKGVSLDEEMSIMMKYQYAYNAAARILNVIDSMIDRVVNGLGRSGL